ncbi:hypothetical protein KSP39_PZI002631 [Platanthera zijinensis]|uniref:Uncharacterized protein n=1 Tax=Platanthera zijinensis TaxID=2320716 RepID=A0AAP0GE32_9ASPA
MQDLPTQTTQYPPPVHFPTTAALTSPFPATAAAPPPPQCCLLHYRHSLSAFPCIGQNSKKKELVQSPPHLFPRSAYSFSFPTTAGQGLKQSLPVLGSEHSVPLRHRRCAIAAAPPPSLLRRRHRRRVSITAAAAPPLQHHRRRCAASASAPPPPPPRQSNYRRNYSSIGS